MKHLFTCSLVFVFLISLCSVHVESGPVEEAEKVLKLEDKGEKESGLKQFPNDCFALQNFYRTKHGASQLTLDSGLSAVAAGCARMYSNGAALHSCPGNRGLGENIASSSGGPITIDQLCLIGVNMFYAENRLYNYANPNINNWEQTGHFTYMIWRSTTSVGIGCAQGSTTQCVSLYRPQGNVPTVAAYIANVRPPISKNEEQEENQLAINTNQNYNVTIS